MTAKTFEIRDRLTFIPVLAVRLDPVTEQDRYLLARSGYGLHGSAQRQYVQLMRLAGGNGENHCDPYNWDDRTLQVAHGHIVHHFDELESGAVIDVEHILGESETPKRSEAAEAPL